MRFSRSSGILLHPTSLPSAYGIGDLGDAAYRFVDFLVAAGQTLWQILPLGPTSFGDSPYQCFSAFAGNPLLISFDRMVADGLLDPEDLRNTYAAHAHHLSHDYVDYGPVIDFKLPLLRRSYERLRAGYAPNHNAPFAAFCAEQTLWLDDYALFMALKDAHGGVAWNNWGRDIAAREPEALARWRDELVDQIEVQKYLQYLFFSQWGDLKQYANDRGIKVIGDAPIFVAYDSADVWANPELFYLDDFGNPTVVAGVPPDYFSATGQRWGNPLYRWDRMAIDNYGWWVNRLRATLSMVDILRLDHFRGFEAYWEVPAEEETAINGRWLPGSGPALFKRVEEALGDLPIIAEDLGIITPGVEALRDEFKFPGMKVLHFAFGDSSENIYLPHNYEANCVVYTGTHDNNTTVGWFQESGSNVREHVQAYIGRDGSDIAWDLMRLALQSVADVAIVPLQDVLRLGSPARMNTPGLAGGNWAWRFRPEHLNDGLAGGLHFFASIYGRLPHTSKSED